MRVDRRLLKSSLETGALPIELHSYVFGCDCSALRATATAPRNALLLRFRHNPPSSGFAGLSIVTVWGIRLFSLSNPTWLAKFSLSLWL